jgi:hypothetical protein
MRKIIKMIKKSSILSEKFYVYVALDNLKHKKLILDIRTRWNSFYLMVKRFIEYIKPIEKLLI